MLARNRYCQIAYDLSGSASGPARKAFGCAPGKPAHIVLPERNDMVAGNIFKDGKNENDGHEYWHFLAVAYWLHPDGGDDDEGVSMNMFMKKYTVKGWAPVPNPVSGTIPAAFCASSHRNIRVPAGVRGDAARLRVGSA